MDDLQKAFHGPKLFTHLFPSLTVLEDNSSGNLPKWWLCELWEIYVIRCLSCECFVCPLDFSLKPQGIRWMSLPASQTQVGRRTESVKPASPTSSTVTDRAVSEFLHLSLCSPPAGLSVPGYAGARTVLPAPCKGVSGGG